jgi:hypothetical protein
VSARDDLHAAFRRPPLVLLEIEPGGFRDGDRLLTLLTGRLARRRLLRKLFENRRLACCAHDGLVAEDGTHCFECAHPACRPWLRVQLAAPGDIVYLLDLAVVSARNLLDLEQQADHDGLRLADLTLQLWVVDRGRWGEVRFARL